MAGSIKSLVPGSLRGLGHRTRSSVREIRRRTYGALVVAAHRPRPHVVPPFRGPVVLDVADPSPKRYAFLLAHGLVAAGYDVSLRPRPLAVGHWFSDYGHLTLALPGVRFLHPDRVPDPAATLYLTDRPDAVPDRPWRAVVTLDYDYYAAPEEAPCVPYPVAPWTAEAGALCRDALPALRATPPDIGVFVAGKLRPDYDRVEAFGVLPRGAIFARVGRLGPHPLPDAAPDRIVRPTERIPEGEWVPTLARSAFALCPPGFKMPHAHGIVEALAVGAVPITNYGHLMRPALTDGHDALLFETADELERAMGRALAMSADERDRMRRAAHAYYDAHLGPASLGRALEAAAVTGALFANVEHVTVGRYVRAGEANARG